LYGSIVKKLVLIKNIEYYNITMLFRFLITKLYSDKLLDLLKVKVSKKIVLFVDKVFYSLILNTKRIFSLIYFTNMNTKIYLFIDMNISFNFYINYI